MSAIEILILAGLMCTDGLENHSVEEMFRVSCPSTLAVEVTALGVTADPRVDNSISLRGLRLRVW